MFKNKEKQYLITILLIYATPTILVSIKHLKNLDLEILPAIIVNCIFDCLIIPISIYFILKNAIGIFETNSEILIHLRIILLVSLISALGSVFNFVRPIKDQFVYELTIFQIIIYALLVIISFVLLIYLKRKH